MRNIRFLLLLCVCIISTGIRAQYYPSALVLDNYKVLDTACYEVTYRMLFKYHPDDKAYKEDIRNVHIGKQVTKDYSQQLFYFDSLATVNFKKGMDATPGLQEPVFAYEIINHYKNNQTLMNYRMFLGLGVICWMDTEEPLQWNLVGGESKEVLGFTCKQANIRFKGRDYTAWYAPELPVNGGPYRFSGLSGLILRVEEHSGMYIWEAIGMKNVSRLIYEYKYENCRKCSKAEADKTISKMFASPLSFMSSTGIKIHIKQANGRFVKGSEAPDPPIPYDPIEKEEPKEVTLSGNRVALSPQQDIKRLLEISVIGDHVYMVFEKPNAWGQSFLQSYQIDNANHSLVFEKEYGRRANGSYQVENPTLFVSDADSLSVAEKDYGNILRVCSDGSLTMTKDYIISLSAKVPYPIVNTASNVFQSDTHEYYFLGHQPLEGSAAIFHAVKRPDSLIINEVRKPIYNQKYPSWIANFGQFAFNRTLKIGAYAYKMFPAIEFFDMESGDVRRIERAGQPFNPRVLDMADTWDMSPSYYIGLSQTPHHLYALYWGKKFSTMDALASKGQAKSLIIQYDWSGNVVKTYTINKHIRTFGIDEDGKTLIAYDGKQFWLFTL